MTNKPRISKAVVPSRANDALPIHERLLLEAERKAKKLEAQKRNGLLSPGTGQKGKKTPKK